MWPITLSGRLTIIALVSLYLTNKLIGREAILERRTFLHQAMRSGEGIRY